MTGVSWFMEEVRQLAAEGGWVFWCLIVLAFGIALALLSLVRLLKLPHAPTIPGVDWTALFRGSAGAADRELVRHLRPEADQLPLIEQQLFAQIERRLRFAFVLIGTAPLVGLLGTVGGMMSTFDGLASAAAEAPIDVISGGVSEALITTQTGLVIAVPTFIVASLLKMQLRQRRFAFRRIEAAVRGAEGEITPDASSDSFALSPSPTIP